MNATDTQTTVTLTTPPSRRIQLPCPKCGEPDANVNLYLHESGLFYCCECEDEFGVEDVHEMLAKFQRWENVFSWLQAMPGEDVEE